MPSLNTFSYLFYKVYEQKVKKKDFTRYQHDGSAGRELDRKPNRLSLENEDQLLLHRGVGQQIGDSRKPHSSFLNVLAPEMKDKQACVVYFDQRLGAAHPKRWLK